MVSAVVNVVVGAFGRRVDTMHRLAMFHQMSLLLIRRVTLFARVRSQVEMHVILMSSQAVGEVKFLSADVALVVALVEVRGDVMLGLVALLGKRLSALLARKLLDLEVHHARVLLDGGGVAEDASALAAAARLALPSLGGRLRQRAGGGRTQRGRRRLAEL